MDNSNPNIDHHTTIFEPKGSSASWQRIEDLFWEAMEWPPEDLDSLLLEKSGGDEQLQEQVKAMLKNAEQSAVLDFENRTVLQEWEQPTSAAKIGGQIGKWKIKELLGEGGMGQVYLVNRSDGEFEQTAALKIIRPGALTSQVIKRFRSERRMLAKLTHPNVAGIIDGGVTEEGVPYLVLEYVDGTPVTDYVSKNNLDLKARIELFLKICDGVDAAHRMLIVHRDLKPGNVLVDKEGQVKLLDFGIAKLVSGELDETQDLAITKTGQQILTPSYAAPEQILDEDITTSTDVYSLGVLLFQLLTDKKPYNLTSGRRTEMVEKICEKEAPLASKKAVDRKELRGDIDTIIAKALRKEPGQRYETARHFADDLSRYLAEQPVLARKPTAGYKLSKFTSRNKAWLSVAAIAAVALASTIFNYTSQLKEERDLANLERERAQQSVDFMTGLFEASDPFSVNYVDPDSISAGELLRRGRRLLETEMNDRPLLKASVGGTLSNVFVGIGEYEESEAILMKVLEDLPESDRVDQVDSNLSLANVRIAKGDFDGAEAAIRNATKFLTRSRERGQPDALISRYLGEIYYERENYETSKEHFEHSVNIWKGLDPQSIGHASAMQRLALVLGALGDNDSAKAIFEEVLEIKSSLGELHPEYSSSLNEYAVFLIRQRLFDEANPILRGIIHTDSLTIGVQHPQSLRTRRILARNLERLGQFKAAEIEFKTALDGYEAFYPDGHIDTIISTYGLGRVLRKNGKLNESVTTLQDALDIATKINERPTIISSIQILLVQTHLLLGNVNLAIAESDKAHSIVVDSFDPSHSRFGQSVAIRGLSYALGGSTKFKREAIDAFNQKVSMFGLDSGDVQWLVRVLEEKKELLTPEDHKDFLEIINPNRKANEN